MLNVATNVEKLIGAPTSALALAQTYQDIVVRVAGGIFTHSDAGIVS